MLKSNKSSTGITDELRIKEISPRLFLVLLVIALIALIATIYFYKQLADLKENPQLATQKEEKVLIERVGRLIALPEGEQPTIATVTDLGPLKDVDFFANAKVGDRVLIYTANKKAIIYDPNQNKLIEVASLNIGN